MPGSSSLFLGLLITFAFWACLLAAAVWRLRQRLSPEAKPTLWTYVNELGGYLVVGLLLGGTLIWQLVQRLAEP